MDAGTAGTVAGRAAVVFDPFPLWTEAVERSLGGIGINVCGKATTWEEAFSLLGEHRPDILVAGGRSVDAEAIREALSGDPTLKVIVLSADDDEAHRHAVFAAGAAAYVLKTARPEDVALAVRQAFDHSIFFASVNGGHVAPLAGPSAATAAELTTRELEILRLVSEGHSNSKLARMLWVTEQTVKFHLSNIYRKLGVANRTEAGRWAQVHGLLPAEPSELVRELSVAG